MIHLVNFVQLSDVVKNLISFIRFFNPDYTNVVHECSLLGLEMRHLKFSIFYNNNDNNSNNSVIISNTN